MKKVLKNDKTAEDYNKYSDEIKQAIAQLENELLEDWRKFKENPYWMVEEWNAKIIKQKPNKPHLKIKD